MAADILLIEDNLQDIEMVLFTFREHDMNYPVLVLQDGVYALDYFFGAEGCGIREETSPLPKVILLDLKLPRVNGVEVLKALKSDERTRHIPVVVFTSSGESRDKAACYALGVNSYVVKPMNSDEFSRVVAGIVSYWIEMNAALYDNAYML
jgi:two-component system response regulator